MKADENHPDRPAKYEHTPPEMRAEIHFPDPVEAKRTADQNRQHTTQKVIAVAAWAAFVAALCYAVIAQRQLGQMQEQTAQLYHQSEVENAGASARAFEVDRQLKIAQQQASSARDQAIAARDNIVAVRKGIEESSNRSKETLNATIESSRLDQRSWIGVVDVVTEGGKVEDRGFGFRSIRISIRNSGKTPALKMSVDCCMYVTRVWTDPAIPDYDSEIAKQQEEATAQVSQNPRIASAVARFQRETEAAKKRDLHEGALAPGVVSQVQLVAGGMMLGGLEMVHEPVPSDPQAMQAYFEKRRQFPRRLYVIGKIIYSDIFPGTTQHITTICLVREPGAQSLAFSTCPQGRMD